MMSAQKRGTYLGLDARSVVLLAGALALALAAAGPASRAARAFDAGQFEPSVYKIYTYIPQKNGQTSIGTGSGFLISGRRFVVTNFHVVEGGEQFFIAYRDGREVKLVEAKRADDRATLDLALLEARENLPGVALRLGDYDPEKLAEVIAIGFPAAANLNTEIAPMAGPRGSVPPLTDLDSTVTQGAVSRMTFTNLKISDTQQLSARTVQHNSAINPGNSGGPLLDACGLVIGVNTLQGLNSQGLFFSIHASEVARFLREGQIAFASTTRPCAGGLGNGFVPLMMGLSAALALGALAFMMRTRKEFQFLRALPKAFARLAPSGGSAKRARSSLYLPGGHGSASAGVLSLRPTDGGLVIHLDESGRAQTIGRGPGADILVAGDTVSKIHARLVYDRSAGRVRITDLGSSNGTFLDGARISEAEAAPKARLRLGTAEYTVTVEAHEPPPAVLRGGGGWMLSGFDPSGRALQFELRVSSDDSGADSPATWTFGRDPGRATFVIEDTSVSSLHAQLMYDGEALILRDMGSMNGTRIDGESIGERAVSLRESGQEITFGLARLRLSRVTA